MLRAQMPMALQLWRGGAGHRRPSTSLLRCASSVAHLFSSHSANSVQTRRRSSSSRQTPAFVAGVGGRRTLVTTIAARHSSDATTLRTLQKMQAEGEPITVMTAYDYTSAQLAQLGGVDAVLVGDSLGNVILGYDSTVPVTMDDMVRHTAAVTRTLNGKGPWVFADLPFGAYLTADQAVHNACRLIKEGGAAAVKMEGGSVQPDIMAQTRAVVGAGIPVVGHLGFTPQTVAALGGYAVQGRSAASAVRLMEEALALQEAGCVALVLEMVPSRVATNVTEALDIPTIGIGAGPGTSGQVLVFHDLVGLFDKFTPKFAPRFSEAGQVMRQGVEAYHQQVKAGTFPDPKMHGYAIPEADFVEFQAATAHLRKGRPAPRPPGGTKRSMSTWAAAGGQTRNIHAASRPERVAILGGGALGSLLAGHLAKVDHVQTFLLTSWQEHADAINRDGLTCQWTDGRTELVSGVRARSPFRAAEVVSEAGGPFDLALVLVKGPATAAAGELAARLLSGANADGALLTLQNGAGNVRVLRQATSSLTPVLVGVTYHGAMAPAPGQVLHTGKGATVLAVSTDEDNNDGEMELRRVWAHRIASLLQSAGMECTVEESAGAAQALIWDKLMVNAAINPVCALLDIRNGELLDHPGALEIAEKAATEVSILADALSKRLAEALRPPKREVEAPAVRVRRVLQATSSNICSMLADVRRGVPTEVHSITGHVVAMGREMNIPTPTNERLLQEMLRLESWSVHALAGRGSLLQPYRTNDATPASPIGARRAAAATPVPRPAWMSRGICSLPRSPVRQASRSMASATGVSGDSTVTVLPTFHELRTWRRALHPEATVGFVPTMGALHEAHLSLVDAARRDCDMVVASVYVNPAQFAANEDLSLYPRTFEQDLAKLSERGVDAVFCPSDAEMYPDGTTDVQLRVVRATELAEGASRPHFFDGVALVCSKLFNLVQPHRAYFGEKDAQQCVTIKQLVRDLNIPLDVVICPTLRESDGLAMSSRNLRLDAVSRAKAPVLSRALFEVRDGIARGKITSAEEARTAVEAVLASEPDLQVLYVSVGDGNTLRELPGTAKLEPQTSVCISLAGVLGGVRLIDNIIIGK